MRWPVFALIPLTVAMGWSASRPADIPFEKITLDLGANETCAFADLNRDGKLDIVSGENWYAAPRWTKTRFRELNFFNNYIDAFADLPLDVDGDGWIDIVTATWFSREIAWWKNPGRTRGAWTKYPIESAYNTEFAFLVDMDNDGKAQEILPQFGGANAITAWYGLEGGKWVRHVVSEKAYGHGIGAGDLNGDGKTDVLTPRGWFEAPGWIYHADWEFKEGLSFMHVVDVNGDGRMDVLTANAHDYGIFWLENTGKGQWPKRRIDDTWSQAHALTLVDLNGDGKKDLVTGKRYMAHENEPGAREPLGLYWYETIQAPNPQGQRVLQWVRHVIDYSSQVGGGMQIAVADIDSDGDLDLAAPGKSGLFLFLNRTK